MIHERKEDWFQTLLPRTLLRKSMVWLGVAIIASAGLAYFVFNGFLARTFDAQLRSRGNSTISILRQHEELRLALVLHEDKVATRVAEEILKGDSDLRYVLFLDAEGRPFGRALAPDVSPADVAKIIRAHRAQTRSPIEALQFTGEVTRDRLGPSEASDDMETQKSAILGKIMLGLSSRAARQKLNWQTLLTVLSTALLVALTSGLFFAQMVNRLNRMATFAARVAGGDLMARLPDDASVDEIGKLANSLEEMTGKTGAMVARLQDAARALAKTSAEILTSSSQQGLSATRQAIAVSQTGATVAQLRENFHQASERAQRVIDLAKKSEDSTVSGRLAVQESVASMVQIRDQVMTISRTILGLVERTNQIGTIIDAVNDLAEQSNVLALNAAIEAAKAGEHGRGFAVVAREVRTLAERSKESTSQVRSILLDIDRASRDALGVIEEGTRKTHTGMELANRAGQSIAVLDQAITESSTAAKQIASSTRQQAEGVEQIWQAMREIDRVVNESASGIRQLESASKNMKALSDAMAQLVTQYRVERSTPRPTVS